MANVIHGITASEKFLTCNAQQTELFSVNPDVPVVDALEMSSCFLGDALTAMVLTENPSYAAQRCIELARAVINAILRGGIEQPVSVGLETADRRQRDVIERLAQLSREGALIVNPAADSLAANDARQFIEWTVREAKGGAA